MSYFCWGKRCSVEAGLAGTDSELALVDGEVGINLRAWETEC